MSCPSHPPRHARTEPRIPPPPVRRPRGAARHALAALLGSLLACTATAAPAEPAPEPGRSNRLDFASFQIISEKNIFSANRSGRSLRGSRETPRRSARVDTIALVGTLDYEKGMFAFFDGSSSEYRKSARTNDTVAGYKLTAIHLDRVTLEANGKTLELPVGSALRREDDGAWEVSASAPASFASSSSSSSSPSPNPSPSQTASSTSGASGSTSGSASGTGGISDALRRLMERREKELQ